ncbi:MAG TPA: adenylate/guanylate cyclase domain-containing protein [Rhodocyclaceae bacterium]|nr:adenylate/guanylate cyclase domain-containing protein [Rhodocyclaceae bacterium]
MEQNQEVPQQESAEPAQKVHWSRLWHPLSWSIAARLSAALVVTALIPMLTVGYYNLSQSLESMRQTEARNIEQLAATTAGRIDQFIRDTHYLVSYFAWSEEAINLTAWPDDITLGRVTEKMTRLTAANTDVELMMVLSNKGAVLASTKPEYIGRDLSFREYYKTAIAGREFISRMEVGTASGKPGLYLSAPIRDGSGLVNGVVVIKMRGSAISDILDAYRSGTDRVVFAVDGDGVVIYHPDRRALYHSLQALPATLHKQIIDEKRFGLDRIDSLNLEELAVRVRDAHEPGHIDLPRLLNGAPEIVGYAPLTSHNWTVLISESENVFSKPLTRLYNNAVLAALLAGAAFSLLALYLARGFIRPIDDLSAAADAVRRGDYSNAQATIFADDEFGRLARTFNTMVTGVLARERERDIFGRVVSPEVREKLLTGELALGGENRRVTVLFSDIRDFTTMSERLGPQETVELLNEYLTAMTEAVRPWGGYVNNFIGDAIVVVFGAPAARAEIEWSAVGAALAMRERLIELNRKRVSLGDAPLCTGIGISTGKVVAGQVGSLERFLYTVIGDAVNVAARLETMTKDFEDNPVLINGATYEAISHRTDIVIQDFGPRAVKGRSEPVHVYGVEKLDKAPVAPK